MIRAYVCSRLIAEPIEAGDDTAAIREAEAQQRAIAVELWCANRLVKKWELVQATGPG
jgi:hypothetical protein